MGFKMSVRGFKAVAIARLQHKKSMACIWESASRKRALELLHAPSYDLRGDRETG